MNSDKLSPETPSRIKSSFSIENLLSKPESIKKSLCTKNDSDFSKSFVNYNKTTDIARNNTFEVSSNEFETFETPDSSCAEDLLDTTSEVASEESNSKCILI